MKITIESAGQLTTIDGVPVRVWEGVTSGGIACYVFACRLAARDDWDVAAFDAEIEDRLEPGDMTPLGAIVNPDMLRPRPAPAEPAGGGGG